MPPLPPVPALPTADPRRIDANGPSRRRLLASAALAGLGACATARGRATGTPVAPFADLEATVGGRLGVFALDTGTGGTLAHRADERFAMCSTFKWLLAAAILAQVDQGRLSLDERVPFGAIDVIAYSPVTRTHLAAGAISIDDLAAAAVTVSDNAAANLLLPKVGGPAGLTRFVRGLGDGATRLDREEPALNGNLPGDPRDTTTPRAMVDLMRRLLVDTDALSAGSRARLLGWLRGCTTGARRLRAGLPAGWLVGDKTGSGSANAINDVAIAVPPRRPPILLACYMSNSAASLATLEAAHAEVARRVASFAARDL